MDLKTLMEAFKIYLWWLNKYFDIAEGSHKKDVPKSEKVHKFVDLPPSNLDFFEIGKHWRFDYLPLPLRPNIEINRNKLGLSWA